MRVQFYRFYAWNKYEPEAKAIKPGILIAHLTGKPDMQRRFTIIEVAVDQQEPMELQR